MEYLRMMTILVLVGLISTVYTRPSETSEVSETSAPPDYQEDYEFQGEDDFLYEDERDKSSQIDDPVIIEKYDAVSSIGPPYFEVPNYVKEVQMGEDVILFCNATNLAGTNIIMWYNSTNVIVQSGIITEAYKKRISLLENNAIKVSNVQTTDSADYFCEIFPQRIRSQIKLNVINPPRAAILLGLRDVTNSSITFRQKEKAEFECKGLNVDEAKIIWSLNGQRVQVPQVSSIENGKFIIDEIDADHVGTYQCLVDNKSIRLPHATITINVQYIPKVSTHRHYVNTQEHDSAKLYCTYKANPIAFVQWKKDGIDIPSIETEKYYIENVEHGEHNKTILHVKNVDKADLGDYRCEIKNFLGSSHADIHLIFEPETPQFERVIIFGNKVTLQWLVRSKQPLAEAMLNYQLNGSHTWMTGSLMKSEKHAHEHTGIWKLQHELELTPGIWHAQVKTKNTAGWSKFSEQHTFEVKPNSENSIPQDIIYAADVSGGGGVTSKSNNSTNNAPKLFTLVPLTLVACLLSSLRLVPFIRIL